MAEEILRHYRYGGNLTHIGIECLPNGKDITVVIERIEFKESETINGEKKPAWVAHFAKNPYFTLPMVLNSTNRKRLARLAQDPYLERVKNLPVILTQEMDKAIGGGKDWALRISLQKPRNTPQQQVQVEKPILTSSSNNWGDIVKWLQDKGKIESVIAKYNISEADLSTLKEAVKPQPEVSGDASEVKVETETPAKDESKQ